MLSFSFIVSLEKIISSSWGLTPQCDKNFISIFLSHFAGDFSVCFSCAADPVLTVVTVRTYEVKEIFFHQLSAESFCIESAFSQNAVRIYLHIGAHLCQVPDQFQVTP